MTEGHPGATPVVRILALGDSYTIGEAVGPRDRWIEHLAARLRGRGLAVAEPEIVARTGWTTDELSAAMDAARPHGPYGLVTLLIGVNNQYRGRPVAEYRVQLQQILSRAIGLAGSRAGRVVVLSIPDWSVTPFAGGRDAARIAAEIDAFNAASAEEAARAGARYVNVTRASRLAADRPDLVASDGLHPSAAMYEDWARLTEPIALAALDVGGGQG